MIDRGKIYAVKMPDEKLAYSLALYAAIIEIDLERQGLAFYTPGERWHFLVGRIGEESRRGFTFRRTEVKTSEIWEFTEVTHENFKNKFYKIVYDGKSLLERIHNTKELLDYYHKQFPDYHRRTRDASPRAD